MEEVRTRLMETPPGGACLGGRERTGATAASRLPEPCRAYFPAASLATTSAARTCRSAGSFA